MVEIAVLLLMAGVLAGVCWFQWCVLRGSRRLVGQAVPELTPDLMSLLNRHGRLLLYFHSPHCGPCRRMTPIIEAAASRHDHVIKVDVSRSTDLARRMNVMATPTLVRIAGYRITEVRVGAVAAETIETLLA